jgi:hypothetical protein
MLRALLAIAVVLSGCGGGSDGSACRAADDCASGLDCSGPNEPRGCGIPPREACASDADCSGGDRCHLIVDPCSADGFGSECRSPCSGDASCGTGFRCDAGACEAVLCDGGFACAKHEACDPARISNGAPVHARHHGCFVIPCSSDDACAGLACVNGTCQDAPGKCVVPVAVP